LCLLPGVPCLCRNARYVGGSHSSAARLCVRDGCGSDGRAGGRGDARVAHGLAKHRAGAAFTAAGDDGDLRMRGAATSRPRTLAYSASSVDSSRTDLVARRILTWADSLELWQRDLLRRVATGKVSETDLREVAAILLSENGAPHAVPLTLDDLPVDGDDDEAVVIHEIGSLDNVNALVGRQRLRFEPGLNVVYGNNGVGKSGYVRLLRKVCRSIADVDLLPDAYGDEDRAQSAVIVAERGGTTTTTTVDLAKQPDRFLSAVRAFDSECAAAYVERGNAIEHTPEPLGMISRCVDAQERLSEMLRARIDELTAGLTALPTLHPGTEASAALASLSAEGGLDRVHQLARLSDAEFTELRDLEVKLPSIDPATRTRDHKAAMAVAAAAEAVASALSACARGLGDEVVAQLGQLRNEVDSLHRALARQRTDAFSSSPLADIGGEVWREMWESARRFAASGTSVFPPQVGEACPLCLQEIDMGAQGRLREFEEFVESDLERRLTSRVRELETTMANLPDPDDSALRVGQHIGRLDEATADAVMACFERLRERYAAVRVGALAPPAPITKEAEALKQLAEAKVRQARDLSKLDDEDEQIAIRSRASELRARVGLNDSLPAIMARHGELVRLADLQTVDRKLATTALTKKQNEFAKLAITDHLIEAIKQEMERLAAFEPRVEVRPRGSRGQTVLRVALSGAQITPTRILSEGEHRAVALAFWLGELAGRIGRSAIVLDDPVSSFDHLWKDDCTRRLVAESARRQVIVFTHDLAFLHALDNEARHHGVPIAVRHLTRTEIGPGVVNYGPPIKQLALGQRVERLRKQIDKQLDPLWVNNRDAYDERATTLLADLRKTWEMVVEDGLLKGAIKRMEARIYVHRLKRITIPDGAAEAIASSFSRISPASHHGPGASPSMAPSPETLRELVDDLDAMIDDLDARSGLDQGDEDGGHHGLERVPA
jgi:hypothetical protein